MAEHRRLFEIAGAVVVVLALAAATFFQVHGTSYRLAPTNGVGVSDSKFAFSVPGSDLPLLHGVRTHPADQLLLSHTLSYAIGGAMISVTATKLTWSDMTLPASHLFTLRMQNTVKREFFRYRGVRAMLLVYRDQQTLDATAVFRLKAENYIVTVYLPSNIDPALAASRLHTVLGSLKLHPLAKPLPVTVQYQACAQAQALLTEAQAAGQPTAAREKTMRAACAPWLNEHPTPGVNG